MLIITEIGRHLLLNKRTKPQTLFNVLATGWIASNARRKTCFAVKELTKGDVSYLVHRPFDHGVRMGNLLDNRQRCKRSDQKT
jgi:hypothetical protein